MLPRRFGRAFVFLLLPFYFLLLTFWSASAEGSDLTVDNGQTLTVPPSIAYDNEYIGYNAAGTVIQSSGSNTVGTSSTPGSLDLGSDSGSGGTYILGGPVSGSTLTVTGTENIGYNGPGAKFIQTGGVNMAGELDLWQCPYTMSGGSLNVGTEYLNGPAAVFTQTGGMISVDRLNLGGNYVQNGGSNTVGYLWIGSGHVGPGGGAYELNGGDLTVNSDENVGGGGTSTFTQTGGTNAVSGDLEVAGTVNQSGGDCTIGGFLIVGTPTFLSLFPIGQGTSYELSGGSLTANVNELIGYDTDGAFIQTGGSNTVGGSLVIGCHSAPGSYELRDGSLTVNGGEYIGIDSGTGTFTQTGGTNTVNGGEYLGYNGTGAFTQTGGISTVIGGLFQVDGSSYTLSGGSLTVADGERVYSTSSFLQSGGTNTVTGGLYMSGGTYALSGGSLTVAGGESVDSSSTFTQTGGTNTVTGGLDMTGGTYTLGGGILSADTVSGNVDNKGGTIIPIQTGTRVSGSYAQSATGALQIDIASAASYSSLDVGGKASLDGALNLVLSNGYVPVAGDTFQLLTASGGVTGTFGSAGNFTPDLLDEVLYTPYAVDLVAVPDYANPALPLTENQRRVGCMLNSVSGTTTSADMATVLHDVAGLGNSGLVAGAFQQISPDMAGSLANLGFAASDLFRQDLTRRITNLRYETADGGDFGLGGAKAPLLAMAPSALSSLLAGAGSAPGARKLGDFSVYADPLVSWGNQSSTAMERGYDFSIGGFTAGADLRLRDDLLAGVATGYAHTDAGFAENEGDARNNTVPVTLYAAYTPDCPFHAFGAAGYALNSFNMDRLIAFGAIDRAPSSSTTGNQFNAYGEAGYDLKAGRFVLSPVVDLSWSSLWIDSFSETGAGALDLNVASQHADSFQVGPGIKIATLERCGRAVIAPQLYATYEHEFSNDSRGLDASLAGGGPAFTFQTRQLGRNFAVVGASLTMFSGKNFSVQLDSNAELGRDNYAAYTVDAGLRFRF